MILGALNDYYDRLVERGDKEIAPYGFSWEKISYALEINLVGELIRVVDLRDTAEKKPRPVACQVPQPPKRSVNIDPCFLWDKSGYVLGLTASENEKDIERTRKTHEAFKESHKAWLSGAQDDGLKALLRFLDRWDADNPDCVAKIPEDALDTNLVFRLQGERAFLHQSRAATHIRARQLLAADSEKKTCLVTGQKSPIATLHPVIKGVNGAQSSGASLVSFNLDAFTSYGKKQGENAPVSDKAAFAYTTVLNHLLRRGDSNHHRMQVGDTTVVFWAEAANIGRAIAGENLLGLLLDPPKPDDEEENNKLHSVLSGISKGRPLDQIDPNLHPETRIFVLGLAPNASRLSIRFWETASLDIFARRLSAHYQDLFLEPQPWKSEPAIWRLLSETVPHREGTKPKLDDVSPQLAGELVRAVLTGRRYPHSLLSNLIMRMRADGDLSPLRVAMCKAVLVRDARLSQHNDKEIPVSLDIENTDPGYLLGRLFASLEAVQRAALGRNVNATIRDRYFGSASATPASVFPMLLRNAQNHLSKVRKSKAGLSVNLEKQIGEIVDKLTSSLPRSLSMESQGRFAIGYYHQSRETFKKHETEIQEGDEEWLS